MSPRSSSMFLFFLEQFPAGPCGCASGDHEVRTVTDITFSFHHFLAGDLSSSTDWASNSTRILVLLREHGWGDSKSRTTVFSLVRERWHGASPCPLEWQGLLPNLLDTPPPSPRAGSILRTLRAWKSPFCGGPVYLLRKKVIFQNPFPLPCSVCVKDPVTLWWLPLLLIHVLRCPYCKQPSDAKSKCVFVQ